MTLDVVRIHDGNARLLDSVAEEVFDEAVDPARLAVYLAQPVNMMVVAVVDGLVVGQVMAVIHHHPDKPDELYIDEVGVSTAWRRQGIARTLMVEMFRWGRERGCASSWLGTEIDNAAARALYASFGEDGQQIMMFDFDL